MRKKITPLYFLLGLAALACQSPQTDKEESKTDSLTTVQPVYITDPVLYDSDDPAIWINPNDPSQSLIVGTDKDSIGALYVYDLRGKIIDSLVRRDILRPNNVDIGYRLSLGSDTVDFAVTGERLTSRLRFFTLPEMRELRAPGIEIFKGETGPEYRDLMGVAVYTSPKSGKTYIIAGRKNGPTDGSYLWQYEVVSVQGVLDLQLVRQFGQYSGKNEIEAIAVDAELGYIYYSDEGVGIRKYHAEPEMGNEELALFGTEGFKEDHEGISIYKTSETEGYILISDQQANLFRVFPRQGTPDGPHIHPLITAIPVSTQSSDGSEVTSVALGADFPRGLFVAMSDDKTFQIYRWEDLEQVILQPQSK
ncbi:phytase [Algoriphagus confluentis]|uniref:Phytase n=1 Tax=Algoriphagus confluentis TaxID=1697556 RepID=A0ABQ6PND2_9BACT|nr:phytase [Algoriphagus confluentis]